MSRQEIDRFLSEARIAKLGTLNADGSPSIVPVWFEWDGETAKVFTSLLSGKVRRIRSDARVCLSVEEPVGVTEAWVSIEGSAEVEEEGGIELARRLAVRYYDEARATKAIREWEPHAGGLGVIVIRPRRLVSSAPE